MLLFGHPGTLFTDVGPVLLNDSPTCAGVALAKMYAFLFCWVRTLITHSQDKAVICDIHLCESKRVYECHG